MNAVKTIFKIITLGIILAVTGCASTNLPKTEFEEKTGLSVIIPMRYYTWVKADGAETFMDDYVNGKFSFTYAEDADYFVKVEKSEAGISTAWGKPLASLQNSVKHVVLTAFISAAYSAAEEKDGIDSAYNVFSQIFADPLYAQVKAALPVVFLNGLEAYKDEAAWAEYKAAHFSTADGIISIIE